MKNQYLHVLYGMYHRLCTLNRIVYSEYNTVIKLAVRSQATAFVILSIKQSGLVDPLIGT